MCLPISPFSSFSILLILLPHFDFGIYPTLKPNIVNLSPKTLFYILNTGWIWLKRGRIREEEFFFSRKIKVSVDHVRFIRNNFDLLNSNADAFPNNEETKLFTIDSGPKRRKENEISSSSNLRRTIIVHKKYRIRFRILSIWRTKNRLDI